MKKQKKQQKKLTQQEKSPVPQQYVDLWNKHQKTLLLSSIALVLVFVFSYSYITSLQAASQKSWEILSEVWSNMTTGHLSSANLLVKDLHPDLVASVKQALGDVNSLPEEIKQDNVTTLELLPVSNIPNPLKNKIVREYNIKRVEEQFANAQRTNAAPWLAYCLAQLYFFNNQPRQALYYYNYITSTYPNHPLQANLLQLQEWNVLKEEIEWVQKQQPADAKNEVANAPKNRVAVFTTPKGKFEVELFDQEYPNNTEFFVSLIQKGCFNGINFHQISKYALQSGCPLGNGKGSFAPKVKADIKDRMLQRGLLILDNSEKEEEIDSRFMIFKKYPMLSNRKRYAFVGKVTDSSMAVVDSLTASDILLDVTVR
ncbi:MAG: peptidylprolyl isomerase [Candidatus Brocadiae bacterium]|nr:peptidylprolyl isomerase [Candidatus Brocadiia bacterium]